MNSNNAITKETIEMVKTLNPDLFGEIKGACLRCTIWRHLPLKMEELLYHKYGVDHIQYRSFWDAHYNMIAETGAYAVIKADGMNLGWGDALENFQNVLFHVLKSDRLLDELVTKTILRNNQTSEYLEIPNTAFYFKL